MPPTASHTGRIKQIGGPNGWLAKHSQGKSDVAVYSQAMVSPHLMRIGLLPDVDPNYSVGLQTTQLYQDLAGMGAKSVTVFLDACFTGQTRNSEMLIANARPIVIKPLAAAIPDNVTDGGSIWGTNKRCFGRKEHGLYLLSVERV